MNIKETQKHIDAIGDNAVVDSGIDGAKAIADYLGIDDKELETHAIDEAKDWEKSVGVEFSADIIAVLATTYMSGFFNGNKYAKERCGIEV